MALDDENQLTIDRLRRLASVLNQDGQEHYASSASCHYRNQASLVRQIADLLQHADEDLDIFTILRGESVHRLLDGKGSQSVSEKTTSFKIRKLTEHINKLQGKIDRLKADRELLREQNTALFGMKFGVGKSRLINYAIRMNKADLDKAQALSPDTQLKGEEQ